MKIHGNMLVSSRSIFALKIYVEWDSKSCSSGFEKYSLSSLHFLAGNGTIEFEEFAAMMSKKIREKDTDDEIKTAFKAFDHSNKGFITGKLKSLYVIVTEYAEVTPYNETV